MIPSFENQRYTGNAQSIVKTIGDRNNTVCVTSPILIDSCNGRVGCETLKMCIMCEFNNEMYSVVD